MHEYSKRVDYLSLPFSHVGVTPCHTPSNPQDLVAIPTSTKPFLQLYLAVEPLLLSWIVTWPFWMNGRLGHPSPVAIIIMLIKDKIGQELGPWQCMNYSQVDQNVLDSCSSPQSRKGHLWTNSELILHLLTHVGSKPDHLPSTWHICLVSPERVKPLLQL